MLPALKKCRHTKKPSQLDPWQQTGVLAKNIGHASAFTPHAHSYRVLSTIILPTPVYSNSREDEVLE